MSIASDNFNLVISNMSQFDKKIRLNSKSLKFYNNNEKIHFNGNFIDHCAK